MIEERQGGAGFLITTGTIVVIIDMTQFIIFSIFSYISFVFLYIYKNLYLVERGQAILVASFLYLGFQSGNLFLD